MRSLRKRVTSMSSNHLIITGASSGIGGRSRTSFPSMTGPYMARKCMSHCRFRAFGANGWMNRTDSVLYTSQPWAIAIRAEPERLAAGVELSRLFDVNRNRRALRRGEEEGAQVLALRRRRLVADQ